MNIGTYNLYFAVLVICVHGKTHLPECLVTSSKRYSSDSSATQEFIAHLSKSHGVTIDLYYQDLDQDFYTDRLSLSLTKGDMIYSTRNGKMNTIMLNSTFSEPGWTDIHLSFNNNSVEVNTVSYNVTFAGELSAYTVGAKLFTDCQTKTPTWDVTTDNPVTVPLNTIAELDVLSINLGATEEFIPILNFSDSQLYLQWDSSKVTFSSDFKAASVFTDGNYTLYLQQLLNEIPSHMKDTSKDAEEATEDTIINFSSQKGIFYISLNISNKVKDPQQDSPNSPNGNGGLLIILALFVIIVVVVVVVLWKKGIISKEILNCKKKSSFGENVDPETAQPMIDKQELTKVCKDKDSQEVESKGIENYKSTMSEVTSSNVPLLSEEDLVEKHTTAKDSALEIRFPHETCDPNSSEYKQFEQRLEKEYEHFKSQHELRKKEAIAEYEKAKKEATNYYENELDKFVINGNENRINLESSEAWAATHKKCLKPAMEIFNNKCETIAFKALPDEKQERLNALSNDLKNICNDRETKEKEIKYKKTCDEKRKIALEEYIKLMNKKVEKGHSKELSIHSNLKKEDAIKLYKETLHITEQYSYIVNEYLELLKKDIDEAYQKIKKKEEDDGGKKSKIVQVIHNINEFKDLSPTPT